MLRQNYMNKYKEKSLFDEERFLKEDEEYLLKESRPVNESSIKNLNQKKMNQFIEDVLTDKKLTSILYSTGSKTEIKSYLKSQKNLENLKKNREKIKKEKSETNSVLKNRNRREAYYQMKTEIENYKSNQEYYQTMLKNNNYKKYLEIKKVLDIEKNERNKEIKNLRIFGFKRAYNTIKEKLEQNKEKESMISDLKTNTDINGPLIALPKIKLNMVNVYSRLYNNAVLLTPLNKKIQNLNLNSNINNKNLKRPLTQNKIKIEEMHKNKKMSFSLKNALSSNNGKEFTINVTDKNINQCLTKYSGGPQNIQFLNGKSDENTKEDNNIKNIDKFVDFYNLEEKKTGNSYLHLATIDNYPEIVEYFLEKGANINKQNNNGDTALHIALRNNNMEIVKIIMNYKPNMDIPNNEGIIAFELFTPQMKSDFKIDKMIIVNPAKKD